MIFSLESGDEEHSLEMVRGGKTRMRRRDSEIGGQEKPWSGTTVTHAAVTFLLICY